MAIVHYILFNSPFLAPVAVFIDGQTEFYENIKQSRRELWFTL